MAVLKIGSAKRGKIIITGKLRGKLEISIREK
jgi:hypothetical protein